ncbi:oxidoreductase [Antrihabitans cavernicola]|uniref:SDR family NAD(P)-dependent oxidoreductase n=1 Tax=Antrihabitans cavernicola TaxID=2495913 RepID=A0A5A7S4Z0_9NOCA|nr:oxidoreductase [Spelaeibacter cavernicola]KAA0021238.1 SDR family NAD(P)-dependent oxidoreductase [Spelaeibacter cavernicola]
MTANATSSHWTEQDIPDQAGRTVIVTGANSGLGEMAARALVRKNAHVVLACRNTTKGKAVADTIGDGAEVRELDLADLSSVRSFAAAVDKVDVLINNAGVMAVPKRKTADGFEMQIGTNHLGHFALTGLLLDRIADRVVTMSSGVHAIGSIGIDDLNYEHRRYESWTAYGQSKLANLLFAYELQRRLEAAGSPVKSLAAHPGYAATNLQSHTESIMDRVMAIGNKVIAQKAEMGALPELYAATSPAAEGGQFIGPDGLGNLRGHPTTNKSNKKSRDVEMAGKLWALSEQLTGVSYSF